MTRRVVEKLCTKKVCGDFLAPIDWQVRQGSNSPNSGKESQKKGVSSQKSPFIREAENVPIKIIFERSSQTGGRQRVRKECQQGTHLEILLSA